MRQVVRHKAWDSLRSELWSEEGNTAIKGFDEEDCGGCPEGCVGKSSVVAAIEEVSGFADQKKARFLTISAC